MSNIVLSLQRRKKGSIKTENIIKFDHIVYKEGNIDYDINNGIITFNSIGKYIVSWWIFTKTTNINKNQIIITPTLPDIKEYSFNNKNEINGTTIIDINKKPISISLINNNTNNISYDDKKIIKASLNIFQINDNEKINSIDFSLIQLAHIIEQIIDLYPNDTITIYNNNLKCIKGKPYQLYKSLDTKNAGLIILINELNEYIIIPLYTINTIYINNKIIHNNKITYLEPHNPLPQGYDTNILKAIHDYLIAKKIITIYLDINKKIIGKIIKNYYGIILVLDKNLNKPVYILTSKINYIMEKFN